MATVHRDSRCKRRPLTRPRQARRKQAYRTNALGTQLWRCGGRYTRRRDRGTRSRRCRDRRRTRGRRARCLSSDFNIPLNVPRNLQEIKFETYIKRVLKKVKPRVGIKKQSLKMIDNLMRDTLHQIATHAASKMGRRKTLKPRLILRAMKKVMPKSLADKVDEHAQHALDRYDRHYRCPRRRR